MHLGFLIHVVGFVVELPERWRNWLNSLLRKFIALPLNTLGWHRGKQAQVCMGLQDRLTKPVVVQIFDLRLAKKPPKKRDFF